MTNFFPNSPPNLGKRVRSIISKLNSSTKKPPTKRRDQTQHTPARLHGSLLGTDLELVPPPTDPKDTEPQKFLNDIDNLSYNKYGYNTCPKKRIGKEICICVYHFKERYQRVAQNKKCKALQTLQNDSSLIIKLQHFKGNDEQAKIVHHKQRELVLKTFQVQNYGTECIYIRQHHFHGKTLDNQSMTKPYNFLLMQH